VAAKLSQVNGDNMDNVRHEASRTLIDMQGRNILFSLSEKAFILM
jgi:hypothetical protein